MATSSSKKVTVIVLELSVEEASWLRAVLQKPLDSVCLEDEPAEDNIPRKAIFNAVNKQL